MTYDKQYLAEIHAGQESYAQPEPVYVKRNSDGQYEVSYDPEGAEMAFFGGRRVFEVEPGVWR